MRIIWLLLAFFCAKPLFANDFVLENLLLPDFEKRTLVPVSVWVEDGVITRIVEGHAAQLAQGASDVRDGKGRVIMPAFIDMHSHSMGNSSLDRSNYQYIGIRGTANAMMYAGVHGWLDLFSDEDNILGYRARQWPGQRNEAYVFAAGPCFTVPGGHCDFGGTRLINTPEQAVAELRDLADAIPNVVKIVYDTKGNEPTVDEATLAAFLQEAARLEVKSVVHIGGWSDIRTAVEFGANAITHLPLEQMPDDIPKLMAEHDVAFIPTVAVINEMLNLHAPNETAYKASMLDLPLTVALVKRKLLNDYPVTTKHQRHYDWLQRLKDEDTFAHRQDAIQRLDAAGVNILVGSDAGNFAVFQGVGFHREMYFLQLMGVAPWDILQGATYGAYAFLQLPWGLAEGQPAHFTLHHEDIFTDVSVSTQVSDVYLHGRRVDREALLRYANPGFFQYMKLFFGFEV